MGRDFWLTAGGAVVGGIATFLSSWWFYVRAAKSMTKETANLRRQNDAIVGAVLNPDAKRAPVYDAQGNLVGVIVEAAGRAGGAS